MPMIDYVLNYNKIAYEQCENRDKPEVLCNGFCYFKKEVKKTEKNQAENHFVKNSVKLLEAIIPHKEALPPKKYAVEQNKSTIDYYLDINSEYIIRLVFHPPIV
ncbi:hypothetical protein AS589_15635 [Empedobacter brevis]|nr:hypothetical protein AS589_15635 [Empedobacter brevis]